MRKLRPCDSLRKCLGSRKSRETHRTRDRKLSPACGLAKVTRMTTVEDFFPKSGRVPEINTTPIRCQVARESAGMSQTDLAEAIGGSRATVSNYERGLVNPRRVTLRMWAMATGVDFRWLETGEAPSPDGDGASECARRDSNPKPSGYEPAAVFTLVAA